MSRAVLSSKRWGGLMGSTLFGLWLAIAASSAAPPQDAAAPTGSLLRSQPFDRITLIDNTVLIVDPVSPRPLPEAIREPAPDPKAEAKAKVKGEEAPDDAAAAAPGPDPRVEITIHTLGAQPGDYALKRSSIKSIEYFENILLAEGDRLAAQNRYGLAFEHYLAVRTRTPNWPGVDERLRKLLLREAESALVAQDDERGLRLLRELYSLQPNDPEVAAKVAEASEARVSRLLEARAYGLARSEYEAVSKLAPGSEVAKTLRGRFETRASQLRARAEAAEGPDRVEFLTEAMRIWPDDPATASAYDQAFRQAPVLDVAVIDTAAEPGPWARTPAERRVAPLLYRPLLADISEEAASGARPDQLVAEVRATELGRQLAIRLREDVAWSMGGRTVAAVDVVRTMTDRARADAPGFQSRWENLIERVEPTGPLELNVRFRRAPLEPRRWLVMPVGPADASRQGRVSTTGGPILVGSGAYRLVAGEGPVQRFDRAGPGSSDSPEGGIARLREVALPGAAGVAALRRGDVSLVEKVPPSEVATLRSETGIKIGKYRDPSLHRIAIDGRNPVLRQRTLRRALALALDRKAILHEAVLGREDDALGRTIDGPFAADSPFAAPDSQPIASDPELARALVALARKQLENRPIQLRLDYPALAEARAAVPRLVEAWKATGIQVTPRELPRDELERRLASGEPFELAYRAGPLIDPASEIGPAICPGYDAPNATGALGAIASPRVLQMLLQLELAQDWPTARGTLIQIDRASRLELPTIPLWQLTDHYAWSDRLQGPAEESGSLYDGLSSWTITPATSRPTNAP